MGKSSQHKGPFQFHLSTAMAVMILGAVFLGVNVYFVGNSPFYDGTRYHSYAWGWPVKYKVTLYSGGEERSEANLRAPVFNLLIAFTSLVLAGAVCESLARRRHKQEATESSQNEHGAHDDSN